MIDASVTLAWLFPEEKDDAIDTLWDRIITEGAVAPALWSLEVTNALLMAERRRRVTADEVAGFISQLGRVDVTLVAPPLPADTHLIVMLARAHRLTIYDAAYLALAHSRDLPLASLDAELIAAAKAIRVPVLPA
ncbi:type II toxin-antitoxin system VapC family toxin [Aerophototrophica crusticola]|uniref:type II toxin-antitoxin system VapC family toxin n=1 Tax=Aerophototrophica crusticola TaxID=1709002 RepID=UPI00384C9878